MAKLIDLTGQKIDKLLVLEKAPSKARHTYWKCLCDCGNVIEVSSEFLKRTSKNRDCGCSKLKNINKKQKEKKRKKFNRKSFWAINGYRTNRRKEKWKYCLEM